MKQKILIGFLLLISLFALQQPAPFFPVQEAYSSNETRLATHEMSLETRYANPAINDVFKDNILLTLSYMSGRVKTASDIHWDDVRAERQYELVLQPGEVFAFHDDVLPEFRDRTIIHTYARFGAGQGFRSSGKLYGDGVCHLASLITWTARDAGLKVTTLVNHDFANIPEIPREQGTSIVTTGSPSLNAQRQNLYVENTLDVPVTFVFDYSDKVLHLSIYK